MSTGNEDAPDPRNGAPSRYVDAVTADLNRLAATFEDVQQSRIRAENRGDHMSAELLAETERRIGYRLSKRLSDHVLADWIPKGLGGARTARIIAAIGDPRRFPGQPCSLGHILPPLYETGAACPAESSEWRSEHETSSEDSPGTAEAGCETADNHARCPGTMLDPRPHTGVSSLWHYFGLIPGRDGNLIRRHKGEQASYSPKYRALILGDKGTADQIVMQRAEPYRTKYDEFKSRRQTEYQPETEAESGLPPWRLNKIARIVAAKAFIGDLLMEWKRRLSAIDPESGGEAGVAA